MQTVSRLITHFIPTSYDLSLNIQRVDRKFSGAVTITGTSVDGKILLHAKGLNIQSVTINGKQASYASGINDEVELDHPELDAGEYVVVIDYTGVIDDQLHGLYPSYFTHEGVKKELLMTQFESHYAREMLPCVDEPEAKATFDVAVTTETGITVLGNMPVKSQTIENNTLVTTFDTTPRMSTYLLAIVMGELHSKTASTKSDVEVSVWATPAQTPESLDFALDHAVKTIEYFEDYFGTPYPLPKSDQVAVPDFSSGAMENWGLVTYRETALIVDPTTTSLSSKQYVATVIAHELSHQWFGNLVTMRWWNNLWLNESFANFMEYVAVDALHPDWNVWLDVASYEALMAYRRDAIDGVQPVQTDVRHPDEISTIFDGAIVYAKGGRLMNMMREYVGDEAFRAGLKRYFTDHAYGNTSETDLWEALSKSSGKDVGVLMDAWIKQSGFPVVSVSQIDTKLTLRQKQFFVGPSKATNKLWPIPLGANDISIPELMNESAVTIDHTVTGTLLLNSRNTAHFITNYDEKLRGGIIAAIRNGELSEMTRIQFANEQALLARGEVLSNASLVGLLQAYGDEDSEKVWTALAATIGELKKFVETDPDSEQRLRDFVGKIAAKQYTRLGWHTVDGEPEDDTKLRATIIGCMLYSEKPEVLESAKRLYDESPIESIDPELRPLILGTVMRHFETDEIVSTLSQIYRDSPLADLRDDIASALTSTRSELTIQHFIDKLKDTQFIRTQDTLRWYIYLLQNREGRESAWRWLQDNWSWIVENFGSDKSYDYFVRYSAGILSTRVHFDAFRTFFTPMQEEPALKRTIEMGLIDLEGRVGLIERDGAAVRKELANL